MNGLDMIGAVGSAVLKQRISSLEDNGSVARFMLDRLTGQQVAAIVKCLLGDADARARIHVAMPRSLVDGLGLPEEAITDERTVNLRHSATDKPVLLIANTDDDQGTSLQDVALIGAKQLIEETGPWVAAAAAGLELAENVVAEWNAALEGLAKADEWPLPHFASFVEATRRALAEEGKPLPDALGWAMPYLQLPRDSSCFAGMRERDRTIAAKWKKQFERLVGERRPLLRKERANRQLIEAEELQAQWQLVKDEVAEQVHPVVEAFIAAPPAAWTDAVGALAECEWTADGIAQVFSGLKQKKSSLAEETLQFYEDELPDRLSDTEKQYLEQLRAQRGLKEGRDEDREFFDAHRDEVSRDKSLRAKWERFVYGKAVECTDFLSGWLRVLERLQGQAGTLEGRRTIEVRTARQTKAQWREVNEDVALAFCVRYRGLPELMGPHVKWETGYLFTFEEFLTQERVRKKYRPNKSESRASLQIKFDVTLIIGQGALADKTTVQLIWSGQPGALGLELPDDLERLERRPIVRCDVARQLVGRKGSLQALALGDVSTLQPVFRKDAGSLVARGEASRDIAKAFAEALKRAVKDGNVRPEGGKEIKAAFEKFAAQYGDAIAALRRRGVAGRVLLDQAESFGVVLTKLAEHAQGDLNRRDLWQPLLAIGCVEVSGGAPAAIIAPWHPLRLASMAVKARSVAGLTRHILTAAEVNFGGSDARLFFADLQDELAEPFYPEVAVGYLGVQPELLSETSTLNDYSLMERPVRDATAPATDVDPRAAALQIKDLIIRYLHLQPHERSNMSIMLFNCDAAGLPLETVSALSTIGDEESVYCNVLVRHRDRDRLNRVYGELLEQADSDPDALVVSETSRNFMSKLRIGVMLDGGAGAQSKSVDIAFLHDVVSRQAREEWLGIDPGDVETKLLEHVPSRWSYRRVTAEDRLKATSYLACPRQPAAGWAYLDAVAAVIRRRWHEGTRHILPARQISFEDRVLKGMFEEVHGAAEWVATYDDLLDKRQLADLGVRVIRYRRQRTHGRNMIVSSTTELQLLKVLLRRRLTELSLGLGDEALGALVDKMISDAIAISGDVVLRAAKRGVSAGELIGLVLSRAIIAEEIGAGATVAWFLLDDYAQWLGQREEGIADILALSVSRDSEGRPRLKAIVSEAKYVGAPACSEARRGSQQQLRQTMLRMEDALFGDPGRLDRDMWLSRIADLLLDGVTAVGETPMLETVRDGIRQGTVSIDFRGYSHVFVSGPAAGGGIVSEQQKVADLDAGMQEVFSLDAVRDLLKAYAGGTPLLPIRSGAGELRPWEETSYRTPSPRVVWTVSVGPDETDGDAGGGAAPRPDDDGPQRGGASAAPVTPDVDGQPAAGEPAPAAEGDGLDRLIAERGGHRGGGSTADAEWLAATERKLRSALTSYGLQAKVLSSRLTPNAGLIRFQGSDRLRVEDIEARSSALLTTHGLKLVAVSPMPGEIVIAVARPSRQIVSLWEVWRRRELNRNAAGLNTSFVLGLRELDGEVLYLNLGGAFGGGQQHEPHTLIAGATGSGKSVLIQSLLLDIAATNSPQLAQIYLIDPKMGVDYSAIERLPHVQGGIIVERERAVEVMESLIGEMERRYEVFRAGGVRDLRGYNSKVDVAQRLPMIFLVHDEFAEWMMIDEYKMAVTTSVQRLGVKARAAGIHLIFAAQRPDANVMPMQLRDNLGNRLILKVASIGTSEIALGQKGAETLLGHGHLAARLNGEQGIVFAQAPFMNDEDIDRAVAGIAEGSAPVE